MIFLDKYKLLFISNPKTGTTTVQKQLLELDESSVLNRLPKRLIEKGLPSKFKEHDTALSVRKGLGDYWFEFSSFVFVRDIHEKAVSAYFFYKNGKPLTRQDNKRQLMVRINRLLTQLLPFSIWSLLKPIKTNYEYIIDENGCILVNHDRKNFTPSRRPRVAIEEQKYSFYLFSFNGKHFYS